MTATRVALLAGGITLAAGLAWWWAGEPRVVLPGDALLEVGGRQLTAAELEPLLGTPLAFSSIEQGERLLRDLAAELALDDAARERGVPRSELLARLVDSRAAPDPVGPEEVAARYARDRERYRRPRGVHLAYAAISRAAHGDDARHVAEGIRRRAQLNARARDVWRWVPQGLAGAVANSVGPLPCSGDVPLPAALVQQACALRAGELGPLVETADAVYVVRALDFQAPRDVALPQVRAHLREALESERREHARRAARTRVVEQARIRIDRAKLHALVRDPAPRQEPRPAAPAPPAPPGSGGPA